jgi:hypothetical protein
MRWLVFSTLLFLASCAHLKNDESVCPEYRNIICATAPECSTDPQRGCKVCQCSPAAADADGKIPSATSPDRR